MIEELIVKTVKLAVSSIVGGIGLVAAATAGVMITDKVKEKSAEKADK